jgi:predicted permease
VFFVDGFSAGELSMRLWQELTFIVRRLIHRRRAERDLDEEIRAHLEMEIERNIADGMSPENARRAAMRSFGSVALSKEDSREVWGLRALEVLWQDLRYGVRILLKSKGFTAVAVLSLALGIGANTAIFSLVDPILLRLLPVKNPEQLVVIKSVNERGEENYEHHYSLFEQLRAHTQVFSGIYANGGVHSVDMVGPESGNQTEKANLMLVSGEYFQVLGVNAVLGRTLTAADNQTLGAHPVAALSYSFWQRRFAGDPAVIGKVVSLKKQPFIIIGVTAPEFFGAEVGRAPDIWAPLMMLNVVFKDRADLSDIDDYGLEMMARLQPGVSEEQAQAALDLFLGQNKSEPGAHKVGKASKIVLSPGRRGTPFFRDWISQPLRILMAGVGLVLLIACANVANLLLARAARRAPEVAIRLTIGAGRFRLVRQFLTESALLAAAGAVLGLIFAWWGCRVILALISEYDSAFSLGPISVIPNARVFGFTISVALFATFIFGLAPALIATRQDLNTVLKVGTRRRGRLSLVIAQVALSLLLLTGAGLFVQTLNNLRARDFGFDAERFIQGRIVAEDAGYKKDQIPGLYSRILERLNSAPGVRSATMSDVGFLYYISTMCCIAVEGYTDRPDENRKIQTNSVRPGYFQALGLPILLGRDFTPQDVSGDPKKSPSVVIINETMARYYFGTANPIGKRIGDFDKQSRPFKYTTEIVGVAKDTVYTDLRARPRVLYYPGQTGNLLVARVAGPAAQIVATIRREVQAVDKNLVIDDLYTSSQLLDQNLFLERLLAKLSSFFALLALLLACVGLYGVMSYDMARRTHEIGIRMALGAQRRDVVGLVLRETMLMVVIGVIIGLGAALAFTRLLTRLLYGLTPNDPLTIALAGMLLLTVAALAGYLPARRAARVDPMVALRHD